MRKDVENGAFPRYIAVFRAKDNCFFRSPHVPESHISMTRRLPPLNAVRAFEAAARHVSLSKAAAELNVTHSAISRQVRMLEARLGVRLMERNGRGLELTDDGRQYLSATRDVLDRLAAATAELTRQRGREALVVNVGPTFAINWLIPRLPKFRARCPEIEVRLVTDMETTEYSPSDCDLGIHCYPFSHFDRLTRNQSAFKHLRFEKFLEEVMFPLVSPRLLRSGPKLRSPADLRGHTLLHSRSGAEAWSDWLKVAGVSGIDCAAGLHFDHFHFAMQAATQGMGVTMGTQPCAIDLLSSGALVVPFPGLVCRHSHYCLVYAESLSRSPRLVAFREWFLETIESEAATWSDVLRDGKATVSPAVAETARGRAGRRRISTRVGGSRPNSAASG